MIIRPNNPASATRRHRSGFTLVELILVMTLLVIVTALTVPPMAKFIRGRALDSEARRVMALMHAAQSRAVSEGMPMMLWIDEKADTYGMAAETSGQNGDAKAEDLTVDSVLKIAVQNTGTGGQSTFNNLPAIKFLPDGTVDETSPQAVMLQDVDGFSRSLGLNKLRTGYEVGDVTSN
ncbi:MAG TPA: GspH/FimT family pseudopilin [Verrucomicrobiae bacterium]|nr:GspH/FimT family pseudopilin [Verrucomicrobiae bacterium]